jgi:hypothetical protein
MKRRGSVCISYLIHKDMERYEKPRPRLMR